MQIVEDSFGEVIVVQTMLAFVFAASAGQLPSCQQQHRSGAADQPFLVPFGIGQVSGDVHRGQLRFLPADGDLGVAHEAGEDSSSASEFAKYPTDGSERLVC